MKKDENKSPKSATKNDTANAVQIDELTADLQRTRADFENYRKRVELEKAAARDAAHEKAVVSLLPIIDTVERAIAHVPKDIADHKWTQGIVGLQKNLQKALSGLQVEKIDAKKGTEFNPQLHEAVQFDEDAEGDKEVIVEELQSGYMLNNKPVRHSMVKVTRE